MFVLDLKKKEKGIVLHTTGPHSVDEEADTIHNFNTMNGGGEALDLSTGNGRKGNQPSPHFQLTNGGNPAHRLGEQQMARVTPVAGDYRLPDSATSSGQYSNGSIALRFDLPISQRGSPMGQSGSPMGQSGSPMGQSGSPMVQQGSPMGQSGSPMVQRGSPVVQRGSPVVQRGSPIDQRDQSWGEVSQPVWDVAQCNGPTGMNIRAAQNYILAHPHNIPQQSNLMVTSANLQTSMPFPTVTSTGALINASPPNAIQSNSPFNDMVFSNGAEGLVQSAGQMGNPIFPSTDARFALGPIMPPALALSINSGLYDTSVSSQLSLYTPQLNVRKRRNDQRDRKDKEPSPSKTTTSSATVTSAAASSDGEEPDAKKAKSVPDEKKDDAYWERRRKNNEAAKRSRDARRQKEEEIAQRANLLEQENLKLRAQVAILKNETAKLHYLLYSRRQ